MPEQIAIPCPWCGESVDAVVDGSAGGAEYVEDCPVCCQPMLIRFEVDADGEVTTLHAERDD